MKLEFCIELKFMKFELQKNVTRQYETWALEARVPLKIDVALCMWDMLKWRKAAEVKKRIRLKKARQVCARVVKKARMMPVVHNLWSEGLVKWRTSEVKWSVSQVKWSV